jgi:hypothetical protein
MAAANISTHQVVPHVNVAAHSYVRLACYSAVTWRGATDVHICTLTVTCTTSAVRGISRTPCACTCARRAYTCFAACSSSHIQHIQLFIAPIRIVQSYISCQQLSQTRHCSEERRSCYVYYCCGWAAIA